MPFPQRINNQPVRGTPRPQQPAFAKPYPVGTKSNTIDWTQHGNFGAPPYLPEAGDTPVQRQRMANGAPYNGVEVMAMEARDPAKAREMTREMGAWRQTQPGAGAVAPDGLPWGTQRDAQGNEITEARARANVGDSYATTHTRQSTDMTRNGQRYQALTPETQAYMNSLPESVKNTNMYRMATQFGKALSPDFIAAKFGDQERQFGINRDQTDFNMDPNAYRQQRINENLNRFRSDLGMPAFNGPVTGGQRPAQGTDMVGNTEANKAQATPPQNLGSTFGANPPPQGGGFSPALMQALSRWQSPQGGGGGSPLSGLLQQIQGMRGGGTGGILQQLQGGGGMQQGRGLQMSPEVAMQRQQNMQAIQGAQGPRGPAYNPATAQMSKVGDVANYDATSGQYVRPNGPPQRQSFLGGQLQPPPQMAQPQYQPQFGGGWQGGGGGVDPRMAQALRYIGMGGY